MNRELELLGKNIRYKKEHVGNDTYRLYIKKNEIELLENYLTELEQIKNAKPSEALECWKWLDATIPQWVREKDKEHSNVLEPIKQALLKVQKQEKELKALALLKPLFKNGNLVAGRYIDWDNPCIMVKDTKTDSVIDWFRCSENGVDLLNEVFCDE